MSDVPTGAEGDEPGSGPGHDGAGVFARVDARLASVREDDTGRRAALAGALVVGLLAAVLHPLGLFLAGALVGLTRRSLPRALLAGLGTGALAVVLELLIAPAGLAVVGTFAPLSYVTVGFGLLAPVWGALLRGAV